MGVFGFHWFLLRNIVLSNGSGNFWWPYALLQAL